MSKLQTKASASARSLKRITSPSQAGCLAAPVQIRERSASGWSVLALSDFVVEEHPVVLVYNGISHAVMMASPVDLEDFAFGFSLTEGVLECPEELFSVDLKGSPEDGFELHMHIHGERMDNLSRQRRYMSGPSGCGLCGKESLKQAIQPLRLLQSAELPDADAIQNALMILTSQQAIQTMTGACHAACWCTADGEVLYTREDVGRHNALDKLVGCLARNHIDTTIGFALVSSRASYELVYKAAAAKIPTLVAVSGATGMAVSSAERAGINLIGFARPGRQVVYTGYQF